MLFRPRPFEAGSNFSKAEFVRRIRNARYLKRWFCETDLDVHAERGTAYGLERVIVDRLRNRCRSGRCANRFIGLAKRGEKFLFVVVGYFHRLNKERQGELRLTEIAFNISKRRQKHNKKGLKVCEPYRGSNLKQVLNGYYCAGGDASAFPPSISSGRSPGDFSNATFQRNGYSRVDASKPDCGFADVRILEHGRLR
jgi:hypothetical protein